MYQTYVNLLKNKISFKANNREQYLTCLLLPLEVVSPWPIIGSPMALTTYI